MKKYFKLILFILSLPSFSNEIKFPATLFTPDSLIKEFRGALKNRIEEFADNYIGRRRGQSIAYTSHEAVNCAGRSYPAGAILAQVDYRQKQSEKRLVEEIRYIGCGDDSVLLERITRKGSELRPLTFSQYSRANIDFNIKKNEVFKKYELINNRGEIIYSFLMRKEAKSTIIQFSLGGQEFLRVKEISKANKKQRIYSFRPYEFSYTRFAGMNFRSSQTFGQFDFTAIAEKGKRFIYLDNRNNRRPLSSFLSSLRFWAIMRGQGVLQMIMGAHLELFPVIEIQASGGQNRRLIEEIRINLSRVVNNVELSSVQVYLRELLESAEQGFLTDRRPAQ